MIWECLNFLNKALPRWKAACQGYAGWGRHSLPGTTLGRWDASSSWLIRGCWQSLMRSDRFFGNYALFEADSRAEEPPGHIGLLTFMRTMLMVLIGQPCSAIAHSINQWKMRKKCWVPLNWLDLPICIRSCFINVIWGSVPCISFLPLPGQVPDYLLGQAGCPAQTRSLAPDGDCRNELSSLTAPASWWSTMKLLKMRYSGVQLLLISWWISRIIQRLELRTVCWRILEESWRISVDSRLERERYSI